MAFSVCEEGFTPSDAVNESFDNYQRFYFRRIVGVGRDEVEKHKFRHTPIENGRYTRLITLLPGRQSKPISCVLQAIAIDDPPSYTALSYKWGSAPKQKTIRIDGQDFLVSLVVPIKTNNWMNVVFGYTEPLNSSLTTCGLLSGIFG